MDGLELIKKLRRSEKYKTIPVIAVTSLDSPNDIDIGYKAGFDDYEIKIDKKSLIEKINKLLDSRGK